MSKGIKKTCIVADHTYLFCRGDNHTIPIPQLLREVLGRYSEQNIQPKTCFFSFICLYIIFFLPVMLSRLTNVRAVWESLSICL